MTGPLEMPDQDLVAQSLLGNRDAFGEIIARYQSLVCALAYNATGSLGHSEDLAQETFIVAWKQLCNLHEPAHLRAWLCGIARNLINNWLRRQGREPSHAAESLDLVSETPAPGLPPAEHAITREEEAILWRSLAEIPELYREPLVLFYREHQSIEKVAATLELTEDNVKQRLSRGRKLLHEQVLAFVEGALERSNPGRAFTLGVLAALPAMAISAQAATAGAALAKSGATAKAASAAGILNLLAGPLLIFFGNYLGYRMQLDMANTEREREFIKTFYRRLILCLAGLGNTTVLIMLLAWKYAPTHPLMIAALFGSLAAINILAIILLSWWTLRERQEMAGDRQRQGIPTVATLPAWEYRSQTELLGLPLVHIRIGGRFTGKSKFVRAWVAAGDGALGLVFAFGGIAVAPVSMGGLAIGLLPFGGCAIGLLVLGGIAIGGWSYGGLALGWQAFGGCAIAWNAALGGCAIAHEVALGGFAYALQANNEMAKQFMEANQFFRIAESLAPYVNWLNVIWVVPMLVWWRVIKRAKAAGGATPYNQKPL
jgi:RNA polymerase sigma factor (sigma-70 family)